MIADKDLIAMQQARVIAENAGEAQKKLLTFAQEELDAIMDGMAKAVEAHCATLAASSCEESGCGNAHDTEMLCRFLCRELPERLRDTRYVGPLNDESDQIEIGVPVGVLCALCPATNAVATTIFKALLAVKSGNAIVFALHPSAARSMAATLDILIAAGGQLGLPEGALAYVETPAERGALELMGHPAVTLIIATCVPELNIAAASTGKSVIYGGTGAGPAFIERSADLHVAVQDIVNSKCFNNGILPYTEQAIVVDRHVAENVRCLLQDAGAYFLTDAESDRLAEVLFDQNGQQHWKTVGITAEELAEMAGLRYSGHVRLLLAERTYVREADPFCREILAPVAAYYVENDWQHACEKCLELLLIESRAHTLTIHTRTTEVIRQFALRKPVSQLMVNTGGSFGGIGMTTQLLPAMTLNLSPEQLVYRRKVCPGVYPAPYTLKDMYMQGNNKETIRLALQAALEKYHFAHRV